MAKKVNVFLIVLFLFSCGYSKNSNTTIVQTCLDSLQRDSDFVFLNHDKIIFVKNSNSLGLDDLYWGANKISVTDTKAAELRVYVPGDVVPNKLYLIISKLNINNNNARVELELPNINETLILDLVRNDKGWHVKYFNSSVE